jgi:hypothetical protein
MKMKSKRKEKEKKKKRKERDPQKRYWDLLLDLARHLPTG